MVASIDEHVLEWFVGIEGSWISLPEGYQHGDVQEHQIEDDLLDNLLHFDLLESVTIEQWKGVHTLEEKKSGDQYFKNESIRVKAACDELQ